MCILPKAKSPDDRIQCELGLGYTKRFGAFLENRVSYGKDTMNFWVATGKIMAEIIVST